MDKWSRRGVLGVSAVVATGAAGFGVAAVRAASEGHSEGPAHLRGAAPLPYAQVVALDLAGGDQQRAVALRAAHHAVTAVDGGGMSAWLALGAGCVAEGAEAPKHLRPMPSYAGDVLDSAQSHGDLLLQVTGASPGAVSEAVTRTLRSLPQWRVRWRIAGARPGDRTENGRGIARNPFHFTEGYGNPADREEVVERAMVKGGQGEPAWAVGGSYQVVRIIRLAVELWDRDSVPEQERVMGRRRDGRWLDGTPSTERADFGSDRHGGITPLDAHVRRAAPDPGDPPPLVRRGYNYRRGADDEGMIFSCFQRDLAQGFEAVQRRLRGEALAKYALTVGGGYFFVPPTGEHWIRAVTAM